MTTDKPTDAMIEAGGKAVASALIEHCTNIRGECYAVYSAPDAIEIDGEFDPRVAAYAAYTAMHEASPQSPAPSADGELVDDELTAQLLLDADEIEACGGGNEAANIRKLVARMKEYRRAAIEALTATAPDACPYDGKPCIASKGTDDEHFRCGTSACPHHSATAPPADADGDGQWLRLLAGIAEQAAKQHGRTSFMWTTNDADRLNRIAARLKQHPEASK